MIIFKKLHTIKISKISNILYNALAVHCSSKPVCNVVCIIIINYSNFAHTK